MAKANLKTRQTEASVGDFLNSIEDENIREDCRQLTTIMTEATGETPKLWSSNVVGFGTYSYKYESGREGEWFVTGFSPRKANLTIYFKNIESLDQHLLAKLGTYKAGKGCLHFKKLNDIDRDILEELIKESVKEIN